MPYFVIPKVYSHQVSVEEILSGITDLSIFNRKDTRNTRTILMDRWSESYAIKSNLYDTHGLIHILKDFNTKYQYLIECDKSTLYTTFYIPKRSGEHKFRRIDAPNDELDAAIRELKYIFDTQFNTLCHTSAFAYVKGRSTIDAVKKHQQNESRWFLKLDFHDFFGSVTLDFMMQQLSQIVPFSYVCEFEDGVKSLRTALSICFLNGGLPQGTPISPLLTNLMMIPLDYYFANLFRSHWGDYKLIYTRYADDMIISCKVNFDFPDVIAAVKNELVTQSAPMKLNESKTRYGSANGKNYILGVMYNKDLNITIGAKKKRQLKATLTSFLLDNLHNNPWDLSDAQVLAGQLSYYKMVEPDSIKHIVESLSEKFGISYEDAMKNNLSLV